MFLSKLSLVNFKNYPAAELSFSPRVNCFTGNNGEGKTNLLDAVHYLSFCKSFFNPVDSQNILHDAPFFVIRGEFEGPDEPLEIFCGLKRNQKKQFKKNKKEYTRLADHIGLLPVVMISPADSELISEGSEQRRKFIDSVISQYDKGYLEALISYNKVLSQRNALLKQFAIKQAFDEASLEIWDIQLIDLAQTIYKTRKEFVASFTPIFNDYYRLLSGGKEQVELIYRSHLNEGDFISVLKKALKRDLVMQYTTAGVHKDDLDFLLQGTSIKKFGSQGQQKTYLISLKLAQFRFIKDIKGFSPILLLDDIYDKLDENRVGHLMKIVSKEDFGQIFITDTHPDRIPGLFQSFPDFTHFRVSSGNVEKA